jgi:hypothetical protein
MIIRFSISADQFNPHEFLKQALELPDRVKLWEAVDVMKESCPGITFDFPVFKQGSIYKPILPYIERINNFI